jgi:hypothetical protein
MSETQKRTCGCCGNEKEGSFCELCKTDTPSAFAMKMLAESRSRASVRARKKLSGIKKWVIECLSGWFPSADPHLPDGVNKMRTIDRERKVYHEVVEKYGSGEMIHETHEPLDKHRK